MANAHNTKNTGTIRIGIDTGGTFTDFVVARGSRIDSFKVPSTPHNPADAILRGVKQALSLIHDGENSATSRRLSLEIVHGTTVATNALLERKGARTALITTEGFEDVIEIGRQTRPELYNFNVTRPAPLVSRELRFGIRERVAPDGSVLEPLKPGSLDNLVDELTKEPKNQATGIESVAVCFLFSFANPRHEQLIGDRLAELGVPVSLSHRILPEYREYERTSTTVVNAYLAPLVSRYLSSLNEGLCLLGGEGNDGGQPGRGRLRSSLIGLRIMQSNGGSVSARIAAAEPVRAILSGPAGGVIGALRVCAGVNVNDIITFDMGGTSTDVALCEGEAKTTNEAVVAGVPVAVPIIDIHTVGAGGGSIARVDEAGALRVGPQSAGADPGPACYGRGDKVTVTDANLVLGRFGGTGLLGGAMPLDRDRAVYVMSQLAEQISRFSGKRTSPEMAALGVVRVANANMERALRTVSVERGKDPRLFALVSFGGAGGLHACDLAAALRIPRIIVPKSPGTLSALGVLLGDVVKDYSRTIMLSTANLDLRAIEREFRSLESQGMRDLAGEGFRKDRIRLVRSVAMRYVGQSFEIDVPWTSGLRFISGFHSAHRSRYGYADSARPTEIVSVRVRAIGVTDKPRLARSRTSTRSKPKPISVEKVFMDERAVPAPIYNREELKPGMRFGGPAVVIEYGSTTLLPGGRTAQVDQWLNLIIE